MEVPFYEIQQNTYEFSAFIIKISGMTKLEKGGENTFRVAYNALEKIIDKII